MSGRLRVLVVSSHSGLGGSERYLQVVLPRLVGSVDVQVILLQDGPLATALAPVTGALVVETGSRLGLVTGALRLRRHLRLTSCDVVHANGVKAALVCALASVGLGRRAAPVVWVKHDHSRDGWLARAIARRCARVVGVSRSVLHAVDGIAPTRVVAPAIELPDVSLPEAHRRMRGVLDSADARPVLVSVGRLDPAKGLRFAIEALALVRDALPAAVLVVVGAEDPSHPGVLDELRTAAHDLQLDGSVVFTGYRDDAVLLIAAADALLITSHAVDHRGRGREGFGLVAVEAMAVGTPVVAFGDGALPDVLGDSAVLTRSRDVRALADGVLAVVTDPATRERLTRGGLARARAYDPGRTAAALLETYGEVAPKLNR